MPSADDSIIDAEEFRDQPLSVMAGERHSIVLKKHVGQAFLANQRSKTPGIPMKRRDTQMHQQISSRKTGFSHGTGGTYVRKELILTKKQKIDLERKRDLRTYGSKSKKAKNKNSQRYVTPEPIRPVKVIDVEMTPEELKEDKKEELYENLSAKNQTQTLPFTGLG